MAIYTEYGRYLKAKAFKEYLDSGDLTDGAYMLLGLGNPEWNTSAEMPIAAYNTSILTSPDTNNQFADSAFTVYLNDIDISNFYNSPNSKPLKPLIPPFPATWPLSDIDIGGYTVNSLIDYYISSEFNLTRSSNSSVVTALTLPESSTENILARQVFSEMYLRGLNRDIRNPVGLLGAVKCDVSFVRDIGLESNGIYKGTVNQFWYGDRFWEIVEPDEYISANKYEDDKIIYPHHLLFTAILNPRSLCDNLQIDQCIAPMQIAVYIKNKSKSGIPPKQVYRVGENIFNFGQYNATELDNDKEFITGGEALTFIPPINAGDPPADFEFLLNDYIKSSPRTAHMVDRIGYIVGF